MAHEKAGELSREIFAGFLWHFLPIFAVQGKNNLMRCQWANAQNREIIVE